MTDPVWGAFDGQPWRDRANQVPAAVYQVPTMLCEDESRLLYWLTRVWASEAGAVCDLGCFAGGSTARLAAGLAAAGQTSPIHAYDFFSVSPDHKEKFLYANGVLPFEGDDLLPIVRCLLAPWGARLMLHPGDVAEAVWNQGPIEVLFIDVMKTPETADAIAQNFYHALIPGRSVIVHQDYQHWRQPWIAAQMQALRPAFRPIAWAEAGSVVFAVDRKPTARELDHARVASLGDAEMIELVCRALRDAPRGPPRRQLARSVLALEDFPGTRRPWSYDPAGFTGERVREVIQKVC